MGLPIIATGAISSALAVIQLAAWTAIGSVFASKRHEITVLLPIWLLLGSAVTAFVYAVLAGAGLVKFAIILISAASLGILVLRWTHVRAALEFLASSYRELIGGRRSVGIALLGSFVFYWALCTCPPRDADVMRYHLAHIRQIDMDGRWEPIADTHYAMPFGWSLNYLPFEHLGLPETAHFLNFGLWAVCIGLAFRTIRDEANRAIALLACGFLLYQPFLLKFATTSFCEVYIMFVMATVVLLLRKNTGEERLQLLGFAAVIGLQSRYQAAAIAIAVTLFVGIAALKKKQISRFLHFLLGATLAALLCAPFYLSNLRAFHNPFWPLMVSSRSTSYTGEVGRTFIAGLNGTLDLRTVAAGIKDLLTELTVAPIPALLLVMALIGVWSHVRQIRAIALLVATMLGIWTMSQPSLFCKNVVMFTPAAVIGAGLLVGRLKSTRIAGAVLIAGCSGLLAFVAVDLVYAVDGVKYLVRGDRREYHRATWFYDVYEWANRETPLDSRFLVIVQSGQSYYLRRPHRRADPWLTGVIDWREVNTGAKLAEALDRGGFRYVVYQDQDWSGCIGGAQMTRAIHDALERGLVRRAREFDIRLVTLRIADRSYPARVWVLERTTLDNHSR